MDDVFRIFRGWKTSPPAHRMAQMLAAAWAGWKPAQDGSSATRSSAGMARMFPDAGFR